MTTTTDVDQQLFS